MQSHFYQRTLVFLIAALLAVSLAIACASGDDDDDDDSAESSTDDDDDDYSDDDSADDDYSDDDYSDDDDDDYYDDDNDDDDTEPDEVECPDTMDDTVLYLSADDSNSEASSAASTELGWSRGASAASTADEKTTTPGDAASAAKPSV